MGSTSKAATNQAVRNYELKLAARPKRITKDTVYLVHGGAVSNRAERRVAEAAARKYGCDPASREHSKKCPLHVAKPEA